MGGPPVRRNGEVHAVWRSRGRLPAYRRWHVVRPQPASIDLMTSAIAAFGGEQAMRRLNSPLIQGEAKYSEPEESFAVGRRAFLVTRISRCPGSLPWGGRASLGPALERYGITDATIASGNGGPPNNRTWRTRWRS